MVAFGEKVRVHYIGTLDDGTEFDNSYKKGEMLEFTVGGGHMIPGFDREVSYMNVGEKRSVHLEPHEAYGAWREDFVEKVPCHLMPNWEQVPIGTPIVLRAQGGQMIQVTCMKVEDGMMHLDHNHFLAGKPLNFEIELVEVVRESAIEREKHGAGCACGCHEFKDAIIRQNAEAAEREAAHVHERGTDCGCGHEHHAHEVARAGHEHAHAAHAHDCACGCH